MFLNFICIYQKIIEICDNDFETKNTLDELECFEKNFWFFTAVNFVEDSKNEKKILSIVKEAIDYLHETIFNEDDLDTFRDGIYTMLKRQILLNTGILDIELSESSERDYFLNNGMLMKLQCIFYLNSYETILRSYYKNIENYTALDYRINECIKYIQHISCYILYDIIMEQIKAQLWYNLSGREFMVNFTSASDDIITIFKQLQRKMPIKTINMSFESIFINDKIKELKTVLESESSKNSVIVFSCLHENIIKTFFREYDKYIFDKNAEDFQDYEIYIINMKNKKLGPMLKKIKLEDDISVFILDIKTTAYESLFSMNIETLNSEILSKWKEKAIDKKFEMDCAVNHLYLSIQE